MDGWLVGLTIHFNPWPFQNMAKNSQNSLRFFNIFKYAVWPKAPMEISSLKSQHKNKKAQKFIGAKQRVTFLCTILCSTILCHFLNLLFPPNSLAIQFLICGKNVIVPNKAVEWPRHCESIATLMEDINHIQNIHSSTAI
jgi:hypothetical protein